MFRRLTMATFRLYMKYLVSSYTCPFIRVLRNVYGQGEGVGQLLGLMVGRSVGLYEGVKDGIRKYCLRVSEMVVFSKW